MSGNGDRADAALRAQLALVSRSREEIAKAWLVEVILGSALADLEHADEVTLGKALSGRRDI